MEYSDGTATSKYQLSITSSIQRLTSLATSSANNSQVSGGHIVNWTARTCKEFHMQDSLIPYISFIYEISKEHSHPFLSKTHCVPRFLSSALSKGNISSVRQSWRPTFTVLIGSIANTPGQS